MNELQGDLSIHLTNMWKFTLGLLLLITGCKRESKQGSGNQDRIFFRVPDTSVGRDTSIKSVVILGNSIVRNSPSLEIGWTHDWGMAASSLDSDFVHQLIREIHAKDGRVKIGFENIADFERDYRTYDFSKLDSLKGMKPDILIMRIGENVSDKVDGSFLNYYDSLIKYVSTEESIVIITDGFWSGKKVNFYINEYAKANMHPFLAISRIGDNRSNRALGLFSNPGVAIHPNDKGMREIKNKLWQAIGPYFR